MKNSIKSTSTINPAIMENIEDSSVKSKSGGKSVEATSCEEITPVVVKVTV